MPLKNGVMSGLIGWLTGGSILGVNLWWINEQIFDLGRELIVGLIYGLMAGLAVGSIGGLGVGSLKYVTSVETLSWKWNQFWKRTIPGSTVGLSFGLFLGLISGFLYGERRYPLLTGSESEFVLPQTFIVTGLIVGLKGGLTFGLAAGLIGGLISGLVGGFTDRVKVGKAFPNQGISLSWKNALDAFLVTLAVGLLVGLLVGLIDWLNYEMIGRLIRGLLGGLVARMGTGSIAGLVVGLMVGLAAGLLGGLIVGLNRGGSAVIKHYALRLILWRNGYTPLNFIKFLDHCAKLILLKKVGGGYIFIHRMLLEYFADLPTIEKSGESKRT